MKIKFSPYYIKYTNFQNEVIVNKDTVGDCLESLFNQYPQLLVALLENDEKLANKTAFKLNDEYIFEVKDLYTKVSVEDALEFTDDVPEGEGNVGKIIAGVVLIAAAIIAGPAGWAMAGQGLGLIGAGTATVIAATGVSLVMGGVGGMIAGSPKLPSFDNSGSTSNTYSFSGVRNSTVSGTAKPVVYGTHRVGGHILNAYTRVRGDSTYLYTQLGLCEGEIAEIPPSSIEINNRGIENYPDIAALWRSGTQNQSELGSSSILYRPKEKESENDVILNPRHLVGNLTEPGTLTYTAVNTIPASYVDLSLTLTLQTHTEYLPGPIDVTVSVYNTTNVLLGTTTVTAPVVTGRTKVRVNLSETTSTNLRVDITSSGYSYGQWEWVSGVDEGYYWVSYTKSVSFFLNSYTIGLASTDESDPNPWMAYFNTIENTTTYGLEIPNASVDGTGSVVTTNSVVDSVSVNVKAPALYYAGAGAPEATSVLYAVYYRMYTENEIKNAWIHKETKAITGKSKSEIFSHVTIDFVTPGRYDINVVRETASSKNDLLTVNDIYLDSVNEVVNEKLIYPNTALLGLRILASEQLNGSFPNITSIVKGKKVRLPENYNAAKRAMAGAFTGVLKNTKEWTDNPVWCLYDFLTDERYGAGKRFKIAESKKGLMLANFYLMAQYCDARLLEDGTVLTDINSAQWETARPRFSLNLVIDEVKDVSEWINTICATFRANWYYSEGVFWLDIDRPKTISQIFNMSNIKDFTKFSLSNRETPNSFELQFRNKNKDYDNDTIVFEDFSVQSDLTVDENKKHIQLLGVTDDRIIKSLAKYYIDSAKNILTGCTFKTGTQAIQSLVTDVIGVQHDVPQWGFGGVVESYAAGVQKYLTISNPVVFEVGKNYSIKISHKGGVPETVGINEVYDGNEHSILVLTTAPTFTPERGDTYSIGETGFEIKPFKVVNIAPTEDDSYEVTCVEYQDAIYTNADNITNMGTIVTRPYSQLESNTIRSVTNVVAEERLHTDSSGQIKTGVDVYYNRPNSSFWRGAYVYYRKNSVSTHFSGNFIISGDTTAMPWSRSEIDTDGYVFIPEITTAGTYTFVVCSVFSNATQTVSEALIDYVNNPFAVLEITPYVSNEIFLQGVTGLQITGSPNSNEFYTKDCKFSWRRTASIDYSASNIADGEANGAATLANTWFKEYIVEILNQDGSVRRTAKILTEEYVYTYEMNHQDGITRYFSIRVTAVDRVGRKSKAVQLDVSNPAPAALA